MISAALTASQLCSHIQHVRLAAPSASSLLRQPLSHTPASDSPSPKFVPSRSSDLHQLLRAAEFASACRLPIPALPNSHLRAGSQCLRCRILRQPQFSSAYAPDEFSHLAWTFPRPFSPGLDIPSPSPCSSTISAADFPLTNLQPHKSALPIYPIVGMAASALRPHFGQPAEACTPCTFNTVTNHPHQKNPTPSSDRLEVPSHLICSSSPSMFLPMKPLSFVHISTTIQPNEFRQFVTKPSCDTFCLVRWFFHQCQFHTRKHVSMKLRCHP